MFDEVRLCLRKGKEEGEENAVYETGQWFGV